MQATQMRALAVKGAALRRAELIEELAALDQAFPELGQPEQVRPKPAIATRPKRTMSVQQRKATSARMRKYWAARRAAQAQRANRQAAWRQRPSAATH